MENVWENDLSWLWLARIWVTVHAWGDLTFYCGKPSDFPNGAVHNCVRNFSKWAYYSGKLRRFPVIPSNSAVYERLSVFQVRMWISVSVKHLSTLWMNVSLCPCVGIRNRIHIRLFAQMSDNPALWKLYKLSTFQKLYTKWGKKIQTFLFFSGGYNSD